MPVIVIEQALYGNPEPGGFRFLARSPGFVESWLPIAEQLCAGFGERPAGVACPAAVFAQAFGPKHVAVVQVADLGSDDAGRPGALGFRLLVLPRQTYADLGGDPFLFADRFPPAWNQRDTLPTLQENIDLPGRRTTAQVLEIIKGADSANMLGGAQVLIDGGRLVFERPAPAPEVIRWLWLLLPTSTRAELWPATFAFGNALAFDALVVPRAELLTDTRYLREDQAGDYPEGRYELALQAAAEADDQADLDRLFARRSSRQTIRLALIILVATTLLAVVSNILNPPPHPSVTARRPEPTEPAPATDLPVLDDFQTPLTPEMAQRTTQALGTLSLWLGAEPLPQAPTAVEAMTALRQRLEAREGGFDAVRRKTLAEMRAAGKLSHPEQELRAWLWVYRLPEYNDRRLNPVELVEVLQKKLVP